MEDAWGEGDETHEARWLVVGGTGKVRREGCDKDYKGIEKVMHSTKASAYSPASLASYEPANFLSCRKKVSVDPYRRIRISVDGR